MKYLSAPRVGSVRRTAVRSSAVIGVAIGLGSVVSHCTSAEPPMTEAIYTADEIKDRLAAAQRLIRSIHLKYRAPAAEGMGAPSGGFVRREVIAREPCLLLHSSAHGHDALAWEDDPFQQQTIVLQNRYYNSFPINRTYATGPLGPEDSLPGSLNKEFVFVGIGLWPFPGRPAPRTETGPIVLVEVAQSPAFKDVGPLQEPVDGRWCHILSRDEEDFLWLDVARGCTLMRRETRDPIQGNILQRFDFHEHAEDLPGVWLPRLVRNTQYRPLSEAGAREQINFSAMIELEIMGVNCVEDSQFEFEPPRGAVLLGDDLPSSRQVRAGGVEHLDSLVQWTMRTMRHTPAHEEGSRTAIVLGTAAAAASVSAYWLSQKRARRSKVT
jgi:hypothetical protein